MAEPTLLFGIGATKSGTSWLHDYLSGHPECRFRSVKELHYFDVLEDAGGAWSQWRNKVLVRKLDRLIERKQFAKNRDSGLLAQKITDLREWLDVFDGHNINDQAYLAYLSQGVDPDTRLIGDVTPSYGGLSTNSFRKMAALAPKTRFIYLMRDPFDRLWSNIRMAAKRARQHGAPFEDGAKHLTERYLRGDHGHLEMRSDYKTTLLRLDAAVAPNSVHYEFFETLFRDASLKRITDFLGISAVPGAFDQVQHQGVPSDMDGDLVQKVLAKLRPQYEFVRDYFNGKIPALWQDRLAQSQMAKV